VIACSTVTTHTKHLIAIVDDDVSVRSALQGVLRSVGWDAQVYASAAEFLASGQATETDCLITDVHMPDTSGLELQARLITDGIRLPTIFITAYGNPRIRQQAMQAGAVEVLAKPFTDDQLLATVRSALAS